MDVTRTGPKPVLVLGPHRSGTSATSALLHAWGLAPATDDVDREGDQFNRRGLWEARSLVSLNDDVLRAVGTTWHSAPLLEWDWLDRLPGHQQWVERCAALAAEAGARGDWAWKDPRMCVTLPLWREAFRVEPTVVLVVRHPLATARSLARRNAFPIEYGLAIWTLSLAHALRSVPPERTYVVHFERLLSEPEPIAKQLHGWLRDRGIQRLSPTPTGWEMLDRALVTAEGHADAPPALPQGSWDLIDEFYHLFEPQAGWADLAERLADIRDWCAQRLPGPFPALVAEALESQVTELAAKAMGYDLLMQRPAVRWIRAVRRLLGVSKQ